MKGLERLDRRTRKLDKWLPKPAVKSGTVALAQLPPAQPGQQQAFLETTADIALYGGAAFGGKAQRLTRMNPAYNSCMTLQQLREMEGKVLTPKGFKAIGDIKVGDAVCNPDGTIARVIQIFDHGEKDFYRVTCLDGAKVDVCGEHLWAYRIAGNRKRRKIPQSIVPEGMLENDEWNYRYFQRYKICDTLELKRLTDVAIARSKEGSRGNFPLLPIMAPAQFTYPVGKWEILPPYTTGALLGDGCLRSSTPKLMSLDKEIIAAIRLELESSGSSLSVSDHQTKDNYSLVGGAGKLLERVGLLGFGSKEKFIPKVYLHASLSDRWSLVRGLMDTDGTVDTDGRVSYSSS